MKVLTIVEKDRVGLLLDISYILGKEKINIETISASVVGDKAIIVLQVKDEKKALKVLKKNGFNVLETNTIAIALEDKPGKLAEVSKLLVDSGINILNLNVTSRANGITVVTMAVDKPRKARKVLKDYLIEEMQ